MVSAEFGTLSAATVFAVSIAIAAVLGLRWLALAWTYRRARPRLDFASATGPSASSVRSASTDADRGLAQRIRRTQSLFFAALGIALAAGVAAYGLTRNLHLLLS